jgi:hypothetical protein
VRRRQVRDLQGRDVYYVRAHLGGLGRDSRASDDAAEVHDFEARERPRGRPVKALVFGPTMKVAAASLTLMLFLKPIKSQCGYRSGLACSRNTLPLSRRRSRAVCAESSLSYTVLTIAITAAGQTLKGRTSSSHLLVMHPPEPYYGVAEEVMALSLLSTAPNYKV